MVISAYDMVIPAYFMDVADRPMEHFPIVLALVRAAARERNPAVLQHAVRLSEALTKKGALEEASALNKVFEDAKKPASKLAATRVVLSKAVNHGEVITAHTHPPVDKETSNPLAEIWSVERLETLLPPILDERLERAIEQLVRQWQGADQLHAAGIKVPRTTLFFGQPGTGKTRLAMWAAHKLGLPVVLARLDGLTSSFLGTTARNVRSLFDFANRYRCVLLLDEFDGIAKLRDDPQELGEIKRVVNAVLQAIDSRASHGITIAITNHERLLDPAVWRRFDARVNIPLPDVDTRVLIVERYLESVSVSHGAAKVLAWMTQGFSGSEVETMCDAIKRHLILEGDPKASMLDALQLFLELSASIDSSPPRKALSQGISTWVQAALENAEIKLLQTDIADVMGSNQSTVSRMKRVA